MAVNTLCRAFRRITIGHNVARCYSTHPPAIQQSLISTSLNNSNGPSYTMHPEIKFKPGTLNIDFGIPPTSGIIRSIIEMPLRKTPSMEEPIKRKTSYEDLPATNKSLDLPTLENVVEKQAVRMIVIRRRKMKKHMRKKLRQKMRYVWAKLRERRNVEKEKLLHAGLVAKIQDAQKFDAKKYVQEKIAQTKKEFVQHLYRGEIISPALIKKLKEEKRLRREASRNKPRLTL